jgi:hypothetical protein
MKTGGVPGFGSRADGAGTRLFRAATHAARPAAPARSGPGGAGAIHRRDYS